MTTTRIVVIGFLTGLLIRHTTGMSAALLESIIHQVGIDVNYSTSKFDLYREYQITIGALLGSLFCLLILPYIFTHNRKAASLYIVLFSVPTIAINAIGFDTDPNFSFVAIAMSVGVGLGAIFSIRIAIRLHSKVEPIAVYHQWQYINRPNDWLHVFWALILSSAWISYQYLLYPSRIGRIFVLDYPVMLMILHFLSFIILIPFVEELIFRRLFFSALRQKASLLKAALISSLVFSLIHADPARLVPAFIVGVALVLIYEQTQSLIVCTAVHGCTNVLIYFATDILAGGLGPELSLLP